MDMALFHLGNIDAVLRDPLVYAGETQEKDI
jgi:hypothetical protein